MATKNVRKLKCFVFTEVMRKIFMKYMSSSNSVYYRSMVFCLNMRVFVRDFRENGFVRMKLKLFALPIEIIKMCGAKRLGIACAATLKNKCDI